MFSNEDWRRLEEAGAVKLVKEAKAWPGFEENMDEIAALVSNYKAINDAGKDLRTLLRECYEQVVIPDVEELERWWRL